jgi:hypothetical protein
MWYNKLGGSFETSTSGWYQGCAGTPASSSNSVWDTAVKASTVLNVRAETASTTGGCTASKTVIPDYSAAEENVRNNPGHWASLGQLNSDGAWIASRVATGDEYWQWDLGAVSVVSGVETQGRAVVSGWGMQMVTKYRVTHSLNGVDWTTASNSADGSDTFVTPMENELTDNIVTSVFSAPVQARYVRIFPTECLRECSMRSAVTVCSSEWTVTENTRCSQELWQCGTVHDFEARETCEARCDDDDRCLGLMWYNKLGGSFETSTSGWYQGCAGTPASSSNSVWDTAVKA